MKITINTIDNKVMGINLSPNLNPMYIELTKNLL